MGTDDGHGHGVRTETGVLAETDGDGRRRARVGSGCGGETVGSRRAPADAGTGACRRRGRGERKVGERRGLGGLSGVKGHLEMTNFKSSASKLPHHQLKAYGVAVELLDAVRAASIRDRKLRDEALRAAKSACLNVAEGAGRFTRRDKARAYTIARGETVEAVAAVEIAARAGDARAECVAEVVELGNHLYAMLTKLIV